MTVDTESSKKQRSDKSTSPTTSEESYKDDSDSSSEDESYNGESDSEDESYLVKFLNDQILKEQDSTDQIMEELKEEDEEAYNNFVLVREEIEKNLPDIKDILKSKIKLKDKAKIVELYELYMSTPPVSE